MPSGERGASYLTIPRSSWWEEVGSPISSPTKFYFPVLVLSLCFQARHRILRPVIWFYPISCLLAEVWLWRAGWRLVQLMGGGEEGGGGGRPRLQLHRDTFWGEVLKSGGSGGVPQNVDQGWSPQGTSVGEDLGTSCKVRGMIPPQRISQFWKWLSTLLDGLWP